MPENDDPAEGIGADVEAYARTLSPNEALCMGRRLCTVLHQLSGPLFEEQDDDALNGHALGVAVASRLYAGVLDRLFRASVGSTEDHPEGTCSCADVGGFIASLSHRYVAALGGDGAY